jgi:hypothetical protein
MSPAPNHWTDTPAAQAASTYFNSLPYSMRAKLAPLLEDVRRRGYADALDIVNSAHAQAEASLQTRINDIRRRQANLPETPTPDDLGTLP